MWAYEKRLQYPVKIKKTCPKTAQLIISQYGGPDGELSASMRYLAQRYSMPVKKVGGLLTDIGTEEINHMEIICAIVYQLTRNLTPEQAKTAGFDAYYIDHTAGLWPQAAGAFPSHRWSSSQRATRSRTCTRISPPSRRRALSMRTCCASSMIPMSGHR